MLVLSRKANERLVIDGRIEVEVLEIRGNRVRLGIIAARDIEVSRQEQSPRLIEAQLAMAAGI